MSITASKDHWNSSSDYHSRREGDAKGQVETILIPQFKQLFGRALPLLKAKSVSVADFACGGGAIACEFLKASRGCGVDVASFGLLDVAADNLPIAESRARSVEHSASIWTKKTNGVDFSDFDGEPVDFLYCWDAMVHFDILDIVGYIRTLSRVCKGYAMLHHSNYPVVTKDIRDNPHWRNFMSADIFRQICISSGHKVVSQKLHNWGIENLDCITVIEVSK